MSTWTKIGSDIDESYQEELSNQFGNTGLSTNYLVHDQLERKFLLYIPSSYKEDSNYPLLLNFHGGGSTAEEHINIADMRKISEDKGFILCYPEGSLLEKGESHWNPIISGLSGKSNVNDIDFIAKLIDYLSNNLSINQQKVYATGYSNGAGLVYSLGFYLSGKIAAIAPVSGSMYEYINNDELLINNTSVINFHGANDYIRPFEGIDGWFNSVPDSIDFWLKKNKIINQPIIKILKIGKNEQIEYLSASSSDENIGVESYKIINGGHDWFDFNVNGNSFEEILWDSLSKYSQIHNSITTSATEPYQSVYSSQKEISFRPGSDVSIDLLYTTSDTDNQLGGLQLNVHYNSSLLTPVGGKGVTENIFLDTFGSEILDDTNDLDQDSSTDKMIQLIWADYQKHEWPRVELPESLVTVSFSTASEELLVDPVTGQAIPLNINYTRAVNIPDYDFLGTSTSLVQMTFNLDVDGDGTVGAFGDGLMVIRKLFGTAFAGDALTAKAISSSATRTTAEIHEYIQAGVDDLSLDVDGDGKVTAFGDGLMVIRKLFGSAFAGDDLTNKAISADATRNTDEIHEYIAAMTTVDPIG